MRILFLMSSFSGYFRQFEPALREMLARGHEVHLGRTEIDAVRGDEWADALAAEYPGFSWDTLPDEPLDPWRAMRSDLRRTRDWLRYLEPQFAGAPVLAQRASRRLPGHMRRLLYRPRLAARGHDRRVRISAAIHAIEAVLPTPPAIEAYLRERIAVARPDVVALTPHLMPGSIHQDQLTAARRLGLPTVLCVASWDNLSSKGLISCDPDRVLVWNEIQREEAVELHGLDPAIVVATGAQLYDQWFDRVPSDRDAFCHRVGLPDDRPFVLYLGGALFPAELTEADWVRRWLTALRADPRPGLRGAAVLVRPHPKWLTGVGDLEADGLGPAAVWPRGAGRMPVAENAKRDFFDSLHHCAAVVGVNTSAMIEAGIAGRRVLVTLVPEFADSQYGTLHFRYLTEAGGGLVRATGSLAKHLDDLAATLAGEGDPAAENRGFLEAFVRPQGISVAATPTFVDTIEQVAGRRRAPQRPSPSRRALLLALRAVRGRYPGQGLDAKAQRKAVRKRARVEARREARAAALESEPA